MSTRITVGYGTETSYWSNRTGKCSLDGDGCRENGRPSYSRLSMFRMLHDSFA